MTKQYWYPCYRHNHVSKSHNFSDILLLLVLSLWAPKTIVFRSLWSWQWNNAKTLAVWHYNDTMSFYRRMKWQCLSFHILEHFRYIFSCLVKIFNKFDVGLVEWKQEAFEYEIKTCLRWINNHTIMWPNRCQCHLTIIYQASNIFFFILIKINLHLLKN